MPGVSIAVLEQRVPGPSLSQMCAGHGSLEVWVPLEGALPGWWVEGGLETQTGLCRSSLKETDIRGWGKEVGNLSICWRKGLGVRRMWEKWGGACWKNSSSEEEGEDEGLSERRGASWNGLLPARLTF